MKTYCKGIPVKLLLMSLIFSAFSSCSNVETKRNTDDIIIKTSVNTEEEKEKVRQTFNDFIHQLETANIEGYFEFITDDFIGYDAGAEPITDMSQLRTMLEGIFQNFTFKMTNYESQEVIIRDDIAIHRHRGIVILESKNDTTKMELDLKYLDIMKKDSSGNWKIYMHTASPNK